MLILLGKRNKNYIISLVEGGWGRGEVTAYQIKTFALSINITLAGFQILTPFSGLL